MEQDSRTGRGNMIERERTQNKTCKRQGGGESGSESGREAGGQGGSAAGWQGGRDAGRQGGRRAGRQESREAGLQRGREKELNTYQIMSTIASLITKKMLNYVYRP